MEELGDLDGSTELYSWGVKTFWRRMPGSQGNGVGDVLWEMSRLEEQMEGGNNEMEELVKII